MGQVKQTGRMGFRILSDLPRPAPDLVERFRGVPSSNAADAMGRFHFMDPGVRSRAGLVMCGVAITVSARPGDNLMVHKALELAAPGDVVVVTTNGNTTSAVFGELMCHSAVAADLGGIVVDGAIRDVTEIAALGFPAFSRTVSPGGCDKDGPGEINVPIACGGTAVLPGDIVLGDEDGVVVVPWQSAEVVARQVDELRAREAARIEDIVRGEVFKPQIDDVLREKGILE